MRTRTYLRLLCILLVGVILVGCSETTPAPTDATKKAPAATQPDPKSAGKVAKRRPKDINQLQGPTDVIP